jgi:hypothetical protein
MTLDQPEHKAEHQEHGHERGHINREVNKTMPMENWFVREMVGLLRVLGANRLPFTHLVSPSVPRNIDRPIGVGNG